MGPPIKNSWIRPCEGEGRVEEATRYFAAERRALLGAVDLAQKLSKTSASVRAKKVGDFVRTHLKPYFNRNYNPSVDWRAFDFHVYCYKYYLYSLLYHLQARQCCSVVRTTCESCGSWLSLYLSCSENTQLINTDM